MKLCKQSRSTWFSAHGTFFDWYRSRTGLHVNKSSRYANLWVIRQSLSTYSFHVMYLVDHVYSGDVGVYSACLDFRLVQCCYLAGLSLSEADWSQVLPVHKYSGEGLNSCLAMLSHLVHDIKTCFRDIIFWIKLRCFPGIYKSHSSRVSCVKGDMMRWSKPVYGREWVLAAPLSQWRDSEISNREHFGTVWPQSLLWLWTKKAIILIGITLSFT